ncbi:hypothetical protein [Streptomyces sp. NPDC051001]|uniref:hypothetical protein n=1 Tax=Streptomyces sp. NPDC051001 TaxID=3155795 RepID=UPI003422177E
MATGFAQRAVHGQAPHLPPGLPVEDAADAVVAALSEGARLVRPGTVAPLEVVR